MQEMTVISSKECLKCILHDGIKSVEVGEDGTCNYCKDPLLSPMQTIPESDRQRYEADLEATLREAKGQGKNLGTDGEFDVVMGLSGGKDSTHLLYTLIHRYGLKVLPVAVNMGFMTKVAKENIAQTACVLGIECIWYDEVASHFVELYKWIFAHRRDPPARPGVVYEMLTGRVCVTCSDLLEGFVIQEAGRRRIPLVLFGLSPDQNARFTYEIPRDAMHRSWAPAFVQAHPEAFSEEFRAAWWDPVRFTVVPRVLSPYHAWNYNEADTIASVEKLGLIPPRKADPLITNCDVLWAFSVYDARVYGCNAYIFPYARLVREGKAVRARWKMIFGEMKGIISQGAMRGPQVRNFYKLLGYSVKEIFNIADAEK